MIFIIFSVNAYATLFRPQPINDQIKHADGLFIGHFLKSRSVELEGGKVATQMIFKVSKEFGLQSDLFGMDEIIVHYPGGKKGEEKIVVEGVPAFISGEKVVIFIKSLNNRYWGMNLGYGTYRVINYGQEIIMVNYIFPNHPQVGQIALTDFEQRIKSIKGDIFKSVISPVHIPISPTRGIERTVASIGESKEDRAVASVSASDNASNDQHVNILWLAGILSILGGVFRFYRQRSVK